RFDCDWSSDVCSSDLKTYSRPARRWWSPPIPAACSKSALVCARPERRLKHCISLIFWIRRTGEEKLQPPAKHQASEGAAISFWRSEERRVGKECRCWL